ncbi:MAG: branched-chain amino acid ABC transporter permease [Hyphomicrobiales bacterium]|nr:branched-chain amino acid ABC transporter permease [Hyphomicrobiales bacterium]
MILALGAALPFVTSSNIILNGMVTTLIVALAGYGWNLLGGYGGQFSFGHAAFFGTGAYACALLQQRCGVNAWVAFASAITIGGGVGFIIGYLSFRSGLRGSYFALVTLAFAEVFRIVVNASSFFNGAAGVLLKLDARPGNFQFASRAAYYEVALGLVGVALLSTRALERSRLGAYLVAVRENENAAKALGVDTLKIKLQAISLSAAFTAAAGAFYVQYFLLINPELGFGASISIEALLAPIIGGLGTAFGPLVGAVALHELGELTQWLLGSLPGADMALFGVFLVLIIAFARGGILGLLSRLGRGVHGMAGEVMP